MAQYGKTELKRRLSDIQRKGITNQQIRDLIDSLWRDSSNYAHIETGNATVDSTDVAVTYSREFSSADHFLSVQAFRIIAIPGAGNVRQDIPYHSLIQTTSGFSLTLAEYISGDVVRYHACEQ